MRQTDPLQQREQADVASEPAVTGSLDLCSAALHNVICSLLDSGALAAFVRADGEGKDSRQAHEDACAMEGRKCLKLHAENRTQM